MGVKTPIIRSSQIKATGKGSELVLNLCLEIGATKYISGPGGESYIDTVSFESSGIELLYRPTCLPAEYPQQHSKVGFINRLSVIDLLLNCGEKWRDFC